MSVSFNLVLHGGRSACTGRCFLSFFPIITHKRRISETFLTLIWQLGVHALCSSTLPAVACKCKLCECCTGGGAPPRCNKGSNFQKKKQIRHVPRRFVCVCVFSLHENACEKQICAHVRELRSMTLLWKGYLSA